MYAVEFETKAQDQLIEIPAQFTSLFSKPVKVIVMLKDNLTNSINQQTEQDLEAGYKAMANDSERELEAQEWCNNLMPNNARAAW
jgi:mRNA-degrading endonuclease RelE of RelBE toxin-antitoxin system